MAEEYKIEDRNVTGMRPLVSPQQLKIDIPRSDLATETVRNGRIGMESILHRIDDQRIVIAAGPCSIYNIISDGEFGHRLKELSDAVAGRFLVVMRTYFEKPRTSLGWKGFSYDPDLNGSDDLNKGLRLSRGFLKEMSELGLPTATEYLESTILPQYTSEFITMGL